MLQVDVQILERALVDEQRLIHGRRDFLKQVIERLVLPEDRHGLVECLDDLLFLVRKLQFVLAVLRSLLPVRRELDVSLRGERGVERRVLRQQHAFVLHLHEGLRVGDVVAERILPRQRDDRGIVRILGGEVGHDLARSRGLVRFLIPLNEVEPFAHGLRLGEIIFPDGLFVGLHGRAGRVELHTGVRGGLAGHRADLRLKRSRESFAGFVAQARARVEVELCGLEVLCGLVRERLGQPFGVVDGLAHVDLGLLVRNPLRGLRGFDGIGLRLRHGRDAEHRDGGERECVTLHGANLRQRRGTTPVTYPQAGSFAKPRIGERLGGTRDSRFQRHRPHGLPQARDRQISSR